MNVNWSINITLGSWSCSHRFYGSNWNTTCNKYYVPKTIQEKEKSKTFNEMKHFQSSQIASSQSYFCDCQPEGHRLFSALLKDSLVKMAVNGH